ncbi:MAG: response regulator [Kofleriaceae bacterium]|nr:response regulator [Kofleriaceae bacterium]
MSDSQSHDLRGETREEITLFVEYEGAEDILGDYTENLSAGGTFVATTRELAIGTEVKLVLQFPGLLRPLSLTGVVRWKRADLPGCGIEFVDAGERLFMLTVMEQIRERDPRTVQQPYRLLLVEDNVHIAALIEEGLTSSSQRSFGNRLVFQFRRAGNGRDACEILRQETFDAMIVDVYLPIIDGPGVVRFARQELGLTTLPIIAISGGGAAAKKVALEAGADLFLDKPMRLKQVIETMQRLMLPANARA